MKIQDTFVCTQQYLENQKKLYPDEPLIQAATFMMLDEDNITRQTVNTQLKEHHVELSHILEVTTIGSSDPVCGNWSWDCMCDP